MTSKDNNRPNGAEGPLIASEEGLRGLAGSLESAGTVAIAIEAPRQDVATPSNPSSAEALLISVASKGGGGGVVDAARADLAPLLDALRGKAVVVHDALACAGPFLGFGLDVAEVPAVIDTLVMSRLLEGGAGRATGGTGPRGGHSGILRGLEGVVRRELGVELGDRSRVPGCGELRAEVLLRLADVLESRIVEAGLARVWGIERRVIPAIVRMALAGLPFDAEGWREHLGQVEREVAKLEKQLDWNSDARPDGKPWNWASHKQVKEAFALDGTVLPDTRDGTLARCSSPLAYLLRKYRKASKVVSSFGASLLGHVRDDGRIRASWDQIGTVTGRMSCSGPNLQQLSKEGELRRCVRAPGGRVFVVADYAQAELRILAQASGEPALVRAFEAGDDPYLAVAANTFAVGEDGVTEEQRAASKVVTLSIIYGKSAWGLSQDLDTSLETARGLLDRYFAVHPKVRAYLNGVSREALDAGGVRTPTGRVRRFGGTSAAGNKAKVKRQAANFPMQAGCADGLKLALALLWERRYEYPGAVLVVVAHDEIVVECWEDEVEGVAAWLERAMEDAMTEILGGYGTDGNAAVPAKVEVKSGTTWGGCAPLVPKASVQDEQEEFDPSAPYFSETPRVLLYVDYRDLSLGCYPSAAFCDGCAETLGSAVEFQDTLGAGSETACEECDRVGSTAREHQLGGLR